MNDTEHRHTLGFPEMDSQHEYLYSLFDNIEKNTAVSDVAVMSKLIAEIERYLLFHFSSEEHLMRMYDFPGFAVHQSDHESVASKFIQYSDDFDAGRLNPSALRIFLTGWLMEHSKSADSEYVKWIINFRTQ